MFIIRQKPSIENYFFFTILFTSLLLGVVIAMNFIPYNKDAIALAVAVLTVLSLGTNMKLISLLSTREKKQ